MDCFKISNTIKKIFLYTLGINAIFIIFYIFDNNIYLWELSLFWPQKKFVESEFRLADVYGRAQMTFELINSNIFIGTNVENLKSRLGKPDGVYFINDSNITYKLTNNKNANWILIFSINENGIIQNIFIKKSCCSVSRKIFHLLYLNLFEKTILPLLKSTI